MPESVVLQGVTSSMLGSFCLDTYHILSISSSKLYSAACICLINSNFGNGLHVIPGFHNPYSIVNVSLRRMQDGAVLVADINCATWGAISCELCTITSSFLLITFRLTIDFARPPIPSTTPFPWDVAKYFYEIVSLTFWVILYLWYMHCDCMMVPSCEILVTKLHSVMIHITHVTQHSVVCDTFLFHVLCI